MASITISSIWRYPVKSMAGEQVDTADVTSRGLTGDRAYALMDPATKKIGSAKSVRRFGDLLRCRAEFVTPPGPDNRMPAVRITLPDGAVIRSDQPDAGAVLTAAFGPNVTLISAAPGGLMLEFAAGTLGGRHSETTEIPVAGGAPPGTLFDYACIHIVTTSTLRCLQETYPQGRFSVERFRPNFMLDCGDESGFVENGWIGRTLAAGPEVVLRVSIPCARCVMTTLPRVDLPLDPGILRTAAQLNKIDLGDFGRLPCVGVYADVLTPGHVRRGDPVRLVN